VTDLVVVWPSGHLDGYIDCYFCLNVLFLLLWCRVIVDNIGDHAMPECSVLQRPDELRWAHVILARCMSPTQLIKVSYAAQQSVT